MDRLTIGTRNNIQDDLEDKTEQVNPGFWSFILDEDQTDTDNNDIEYPPNEDEKIYLLNFRGPTPQLLPEKYQSLKDKQLELRKGEKILVDPAGEPHSILDEDGKIRSLSSKTKWFLDCHCCLIAVGINIPEWLKRVLSSRYVASS